MNRTEPEVRLGWVIATLAAAAASTSTAIPALKLLVHDELGLGSDAAGAFVAIHVAGTIAGAFVWSRLLERGRRRGQPIPVGGAAVAGLLATAALNAGLWHSHALSALLALRFADGVAHVGVAMILMGSGAHGAEAQRARRMVWLGTTLVVGVGGGIAIGGAAASAHARLPFVASGALALIGVATARRALPRALPSWLADAAAGARPPAFTGVLPAAALVLTERFAVGVLTIGLPFAVSGPEGASHTGRILGVFIVSSLVAMPLARRWSARVGPRRVGQLAAVAVAAAFAGASLGDGFAGSAAAAWAALGGAGAGAMFIAGLLLVGELEQPSSRIRALGVVHASGSAGYLAGTLLAGVALTGSYLSSASAMSLLGIAAVALGAAAAALPTGSRSTS